MGNRKFRSAGFLVLCLLVGSYALADCKTDLAVDLVDPSIHTPFQNDHWFYEQEKRSIQRMVANVSPDNAAPGTIIAATSSHYRFHWVRDAAIVMSLLPDSRYDSYLELSRRQQLNSPFGEAKYYESGDPYTGPWARPQNDGPAYRAIVTSEFILRQIRSGKDIDEVRAQYFQNPEHDPHNPSKSFVLRDDLNNLLKNVEKESADLWEEIFAKNHSYTLMSFEKALHDGAQVAALLGDAPFAAKLLTAKRHVQKRLRGLLAEGGYILFAKDLREDAWSPHIDDVDSATILGALYFSGPGTVFRVDSSFVLATAQKLIDNARADYPILNQNRAAPAVGRFRGDSWNGFERGEAYTGNPWVLATAAFAELHYRVAHDAAVHGQIVLTSENVGFYRDVLSGVLDSNGIDAIQPGRTIEMHDSLFISFIKALSVRGDQYMKRIQESAGGDGSLSEQISKNDATQGVGPENLSWSHVQVLRALQSRKLLLPYLH